MKKLKLLSTGANISDIKAAAKESAAQGTMTKADALTKAAIEHGSATWRDLKLRSWSIDEDGDIVSVAACEMPGHNFKIQTYSSLIDLDYMDLDETWSVNVTLSAHSTPYLFVSFVYVDEGTNFELDNTQKEAFERAVETQSKTDAIAAQAALIEDVMGWFDTEWLDITNADVCKLLRIERGIRDEDLYWRRPDQATYGDHHQSLKVYDAGDFGMLVCIEDSSFQNDGKVPYGYITDEQYNDVPHTPCNLEAMETAFLLAANIQMPFAGRRSHMDQI